MVSDITVSPAVKLGLRRTALVLQYLLIGYYIICVGYLCAIAAKPEFQHRAPAWRHWFGAPGSGVTIAVVLLIPIVAFALSRFTGRKTFSTTPLLALAAMAVSALALGLSSYWICHKPLSQFFSPLSWTVGLFLGAYEDRYKDNMCGGAAVPVALELARMLALATTLTTAIAAARTLFRAQFDRIALLRARSLTVVVGIDEDTLSMLSAIASRMGKRESLVIVTAAPNRRCIDEARAFGARVREVATLDADALRDTTTERARSSWTTRATSIDTGCRRMIASGRWRIGRRATPPEARIVSAHRASWRFRSGASRARSAGLS